MPTETIRTRVPETFRLEGRKDDGGKDPWHLLPTDAVRAVIKVLAFGGAKYGERNWEKGMAWSRVYAALLRHLAAWWEGEARDPETGFSHLWHAGCCAQFLIAFELRGTGTDDRPRQSIGPLFEYPRKPADQDEDRRPCDV